MLAGLVFAACRPVHVTKQYYDQYVNPKASIDYEDTGAVNLPVGFLDDYYMVDSRIVRLLDQLDLGGETPDSSWVAAQKSGHSWVEFMAVLDNELLFISGDEYLGYDVAVRILLEEMERGEKRIALIHEGRFLLVHAHRTAPDHFRTIIVEIDIARLLEGTTSTGMLPAVGQTLIQKTDQSAFYASLLEKLAKSKKYSGRARVDGQPVHWIRSMAADNLVYLYRE